MMSNHPTTNVDPVGNTDIGIDFYQEQTEETAIYLSEFPDFVTPELVYVVLGLNGEVGELAEKLKKAIREDDESYLDELTVESGDALWYLARVWEESGVTGSEVAEANLAKLLDREERGVLTGQGDSR